MLGYTLPALLLAAALPGTATAQIDRWQLGGGGLAWGGNDTTRIMIDAQSRPGAIQPALLTPDRSVFSWLDNWSPRKFPLQLGYIDGERPRAWKGSIGDERTVHNATYLVDGDSTTFNPPGSAGIGGIWYTIDLAVPVPAHRFGFFTPPAGYRADGTPYAQDAVPAFEISIAPENDLALEETNAYTRVGRVIADIPENLAPRIQVDFPPQYVRLIRWRRKESILDQAYGLTESSASGAARKGTIADFELFGEGIPRRALFATRIIELGAEVNFGRLFWAATPLRVENGEMIADPDARARVRVEVRVGRDADPNIYHEFDDKGREVVVDRDRFEFDLKESVGYGYVASGRPGVRASVRYDSDNWSFWSSPFTESGRPLLLRSGSHIQLKITLESEAFDHLVRLDSLWIETAPLLARQVLGEIARADDPRPRRGYAEAPLGEPTEFAYAVRPVFAGGERGFDAVRVRTGSRPVWRGLALDGVATEPASVEVGDDELVVHLPRRVHPGDPATVDLTFTGELFDFAHTFSGEILASDGVSLPQTVSEGDASGMLATGSLRVFGAGGRHAQLQDVALSTRVLTPNGDGINDELSVSYTLFRLPEPVPVGLQVFALDGRRVAALPPRTQPSGRQALSWDGRDQGGRTLPPGVYLLDIAIESDAAQPRNLHPVHIAY